MYVEEKLLILLRQAGSQFHSSFREKLKFENFYRGVGLGEGRCWGVGVGVGVQ